MKRLLFPLLFGAVALLAPGRSWAQDKPVLNTAPPGTRPTPPVQPTPAPVYTEPTPQQPATTDPGYTPAPATAPTPAALPQPSPYSPSGLELPGREQERKAAQQHADMYTKLFVYSGIGLGYSSYYGYSNFNFSISPALGYRINDRLSVGPGISYAYNYYGVDNGSGSNSTNSSVSTSSFGVKLFAQLRVIDQFFIHAEYESTRAQFLAVDQYNQYVGTVSRQVQTPLLGVGYRSQISNRAAADIVLLYNFQDNYNSIYPNPVIRFNFLFNIGH
ncbi:hypothetical protein GO988_13125 [Hymenobacter sp. HMF4947]|uniref:Outer membrane protein beta-barrel domain-containing protein n=1 Tax=Hymenobacter ginkgonis TaxID=2682976 RepID=A0A7K1TGH0_9BACT|nr:hypothetical protein [Hymenobacter ginkgonis]MVN77271.1 hypothetical protein [Hymenobacter ginkgonis]